MEKTQTIRQSQKQIRSSFISIISIISISECSISVRFFENISQRVFSPSISAFLNAEQTVRLSYVWVLINAPFFLLIVVIREQQLAP